MVLAFALTVDEDSETDLPEDEGDTVLVCSVDHPVAVCCAIQSEPLFRSSTEEALPKDPNWPRKGVMGIPSIT